MRMERAYTKAMMNTPKLINEVYTRPPLWNTEIVSGKETNDRLWKEVAVMLGVNVKDVRVKWKNLKDNFRKEMKKTIENGPSYVPAWRHYNRLLFLTDVLLKSNRISYGSDEMSYGITIDLPKVESEDSQPDQDSQDTQNLQPSTSSPKRKRESEQDDKEIPIGPQILTNLASQYPYNPWEFSNADEDYHFFMSLIPHMKTFSSLQKLRIRNKIQQILIEEMEEGSTRSRANSSSGP
ncbi:BESS motif [Nesidiocoris tenuis]|uniref:BESS motif n=1 Tax=Nesidiocoris tenuis TaxID=355587 RepID=A0ABN7B1Y4_9HEMI|nr:BESS motif [Nesidiocoris tenuis]